MNETADGEAMDLPRDFDAAVDETGLGQKGVAQLGGWAIPTVNRWCRQREKDHRDVPRDAWAVVLAFRKLSRKKQAELMAELDLVAPPKPKGGGEPGEPGS
ncbi:conserved protein of unknown function (plasmid) [Rhodovastum atsumiense]|uniref:Uncharacterized protein n=1 Tax=Rhodovastum atsumiense TaxID=504468 RepID=A0A5M6IW10_9PROT|nr:hypothetical protein [Rhodovastum atsumiense]KAA5611595.1 hypothetical protein F1189_13610 [Rhodovastum atsumiense]CAH2606321.1 conserved protein of unknown function [Rhodovastum atsumiense]